jgi:hypothetical protein
MKPRPTKAQVLQRVGEILRIRLDGAEFWDVREYVREKEKEEGSAWHLAEGQTPLSDSQLWRYIARADKEVTASCRASRKKLLRRHLAQRRNLYAKAVSQGDIRAALACARDEAQLQGLYEPATGAKLPAAGTSAEVILLLARVIEETGQGRIDARTAGTVGALASTLLRALEQGELARQLAELKEQLEEVRRRESGHDPKRTTQASSAGEPGADDAAPGEASPGPGADPDPGGTGPGPLAEPGPALAGDPDVTPLFPSGWQEPDRGSPRAS